MTKEEQTVALPESVTINGVTYVVKDTPELLQFVQEVAKVEKTKLYSKFESLQNQIKALSGVQVVNPQTDGTDFKAYLEEMKKNFVSKEDLKNSLSETVKEVVKPLLQSNENLEAIRLREYRERVIKENEATCIPDLVTGNSTEEIDASLARSIEIRQKYFSPAQVVGAPQPKVVDPLIQAQMAAQQQPTPTPAAPAPQPKTPAPQFAPQAPVAPASEPSPTKQMSMAEFAAQREQLLSQLQQTYGQG